MMASFMSYFGARKDSKQASRDAIVTLRQQLQMIEKKGDYLQKKIEEETSFARTHAVTNKTGAPALTWSLWCALIPSEPDTYVQPRWPR